jgi:DNA-binding MurR/RpiR family transcriptional regulator
MKCEVNAMILNKIEKTHLSESESVIMRYILTLGEDVANKTTQDIAKATFTSAPLCVRIAKKLGYEGWNDFKKAFVEELQYMYATKDVDASIPFVVNDDLMTIANSILRLEEETISDTKALLSHDDLAKAVSLLRKAEVIDIYSKSSYVYLAQGFMQKLYSIHKMVNVDANIGNPILQAAMGDETHVAIVISYSGETPITLNAAFKAQSKGTPIIAITSISQSTLSKMADVSLRISSQEMLNTNIGQFASSQSIACILDILYAAIFSFDYDKNLERKIDIGKEVDDGYSEYEYISKVDD